MWDVPLPRAYDCNYKINSLDDDSDMTQEAPGPQELEKRRK